MSCRPVPQMEMHNAWRLAVGPHALATWRACRLKCCADSYIPGASAAMCLSALRSAAI